MMDGSSLDLAVESYVDAYEEARSESPDVSLLDFLPERDDPKFLLVAAELMRINMELSWEAGRRVSVHDYEQQFPEVMQNRQLRAEVAYEEYRQRTQSGEDVSIRDFAKQYGLDVGDMSTVVAKSDETSTAEQFDAAVCELPTSGETWRDFEIVNEIGRGALSRVFLARQQSLSRRQVVLKFAPKHLFEAEKLAKLQHANIVPVYSVYEDSHFNVFCMQYLGDKTLADELNRQPTGNSSLLMTEPQVLQFAIKVSQAISHAHERGILHNDIKPANILVCDETEPMLLDFNLAGERTSSSSILNIGGTLPYMAPESLKGLVESKVASDERSDIFSLGAVLFEIVAGCQPFANTNNIESAIALRNDASLQQRLQRATPGLASILSKCLAFSPADRYQSASQLSEDLQLHLSNRPLRYATNTSKKERFVKWCRRHPRVTSLTSIACLLTFLSSLTAIAWFARERYVSELEAVTKFAEFQASVEQLIPELSAIGLDAVNAEASVKASEQLLSEYVHDGSWKSDASYQLLNQHDQQAADATLSRLAFLTGTGHAWLAQRSDDNESHLQAAKKWNQCLQAAGPQSTVANLVLRERMALAGERDETARNEELLTSIEDSTADELQIAAILTSRERDFDEAARMLEAACEKSGHDYSKWFDLASVYGDVGDWQKVEPCLTTCLALRPDARLAYYLRGRARHELGKHREAIADYSRFLGSAEDHPIALLNRAISRKAAGDYDDALKDLNRAMARGYAGPRPLIIRSRIHRLNGDIVQARDDLQKAMSATPQNELDWVSLGVALMNRKPTQALTSFRTALKLNPNSHAARRNIAHVLSERLGRTDEAIECLDDLIRSHPNDIAAVAGRGVLLAREKRFDEAIEEAKRVVDMNGGPRTILQAACIYSLATQEYPELRETAIALLGSAFRADEELASLAKSDPDLRDIQDLDEFTQLCDAARKLAELPAVSSSIKRSAP